MAETNDTGKVIATAGLAAGAIGTVVAVLNSRRRTHEDRYALELDVQANRKELEQLAAAVETRRKELSSLLVSAPKRARKRTQSASVREIDFDALQHVDWASLSRRARKGLERARQEAAKRAPADATDIRDRVVRQGSDVSKSAKSFGEHLADEFQKYAPELKAAFEAELAPRTKSASKLATDLGSSVSDIRDKARATADETLPGAQKRASDLAEAVKSQIDHARPVIEDAAARTAERVKSQIDHARPTLEDAAGKLREQIDHARPVVEDAAAKATEVVRHGIVDARPIAEDLSTKVRDAAKHAPDTFAEELKRAEEVLGEFAGSAQKRSADALELAEEKARAGAVAAKDGTKEGTSFLFWTGAAASVIYFAFLNDEQRDKVKSIATTVFGEVRDLVNDIQGKDGSFTS